MPRPFTGACEGSPEYTMEETIKAERGTDVVLHLNEEFSQYLEDATIEGLLKKYCKFLPVEIAFGKKKEWKDGKQVVVCDQDGNEEENIINNTEPAWTKKPSELKDEDYDKFYHEPVPHADGRAALPYPPERRLSVPPDGYPVLPEDQEQPGR